MRKVAPLLVLACVVVACAPTAEQAPPPYRAPALVWSWLSLDFPPSVDVYGGPTAGHAAVDEAFASAGSYVLACAHRIAQRESNEYPTSDNPNGHHGLFQLGNHFWGSLVAAASTLHQWPWWWSGRQNALAARLIYNQVGWAPWGGCP